MLDGGCHSRAPQRSAIARVGQHLGELTQLVETFSDQDSILLRFRRNHLDRGNRWLARAPLWIWSKRQEFARRPRGFAALKNDRHRRENWTSDEMAISM